MRRALVALALLLVVPTAAAAEGAADIVPAGVVRLTGAVDISFDDVSVWADDGASISLRAASARGFVHGYVAAADPEGELAQFVVREWSTPVEVEDLSLVLRPDDVAIVAADAARASGAAAGTSIAEKTRFRHVYYAGRGPSFDFDVPAGRFAVDLPGTLRADSALAILVSGAYEGNLSGDVGTRPERGAPGLVNVTYLVLELEDAEIESDGSAYARRFEASVDGKAAFPAATGVVREGGEWRFAREALAIRGALSVTGFPKEAPPPILRGLDRGVGGDPRYVIEGNFVSVEVGNREVYRAAAAAGATGLALTALGLWLYSRIQRGDVLAHPLRARILEVVRAQPGIQQERLQESLGLPWGTFRYHLHVLRRNRLVRVEPHGRYRLVHLADAACDPRARLAAQGKALAVYEWLAANPGASAGDAARALGLARQLVGHHLTALERSGLVQRDGEGPARWSIVPTP